MQIGPLLSSADSIDFMIHGLFKYSFFGHEVWITTSHVCILIVMLIIIGFAIERAMSAKTTFLARHRTPPDNSW